MTEENVEKTTTIASSNVAQQLHGVGGLFSGQGIERDVITAMIRPRGISTVLSVYPSVVEDPRFPAITGFTATVGTEPTLPCNDAPISYIKTANLTARFGMTRMDTETIDIGKTMLRKNRGDLTDYIIRGKLLGMTDLEPSGMTEERILEIMTKSEMFKAAINAERKLSKTLWQGTAVANSFPGLDVQIATGQKDADSGVAAPALDSDIKDFNFNLVTGTTLDINEYLGSTMWYLNYNAEAMGLDPVEWVIVMRPELWFELTAAWPIKYNTTARVSLPTGNSVFMDARQNVQERDSLRQRMVLTINGKDYRVVTDTGIFEYNNINTASCKAGEYASAIYIVPLTIQGGFPVTYREYLDFRATQPDVSFLKGLEHFWTDDGIYSWAMSQDKWCYKLSLRTEQRVVLRTPQLAAKITKIKYVPVEHLRQPYPEDPYFANGGVSLRAGSFGQAVWG